MNLFLAGSSAAGEADADRAAAVLESLRAPFFGAEPVQRWTAPSGRTAAAWLAHAPERVGGVRYAASDGGRLALFAGRPIRWAGEEADGRGPLDPAAYLEGVPDGMDGRFAVLRAGDDGIEVVTDALGAYPVFRCGGWVSNSPEALRRLCGADELGPGVLAGVLGGGWSLSGDPVWAAITRVPWGAGSPPAAGLCGAGFDPDRAARLLVAGTRALADWPGRPNVVLVTGGRDSRLVLAAALRAGVEMQVRTGGTGDMPDVVIGRQLAAAAGVEHRMLDPHPFGDFAAHWRDMARVLAQTTGATATLADAAGFPLVALDGPLPLWHTGQGGEIARGYYGGVDLDGLVRRFLGKRPGRSGVLSEAGELRVQEQVSDWAAPLGAAAEDLGDLFYLDQRMARWAAPTHTAVEPIRDSTSPLWSIRLLPDLLGLPAAARAREEFHLRVLERLAPELVDLPFEGGRPWPSRQSALARRSARARTLARKVAAEARRRRGRGAILPTGGEPADPFAAALAEIRALVLADTLHLAWAVLDRSRVEALLSTPAPALDAMSRAYVWRLATVFGGLPAGPAAQ
ncbi:MAG: hypothetical protein QOG68_1126 [Solirubrobacteraceae bacterium]|nr:hypothetical protein [Solirubrobacteraceae bacterium]